jgi:DNA invertase Pin-like site-specific DNA recombinase
MKPKAYSYIRFSTKEQEKGGSEKRQMKDTEAIAKDVLKLELDNTLHLTDKGLSGWTGDNLTKGALGEFIKLADEGKIAEGSVLIMEKLDRLTRLPVLEAHNLLTGILLRGIGVYTTIDKNLLTRETFNVSDSILSSINLDQGNKESDTKQNRIADGWEEVRKAIKSGDRKKIFSNCPLWLEPIPDQEILKNEHKFVTIDFNPIPKAVEAITLIYKMKKAGKGSNMIAQELNKIKDIWIPNRWKQENPLWSPSTVEFYLNNNRTLLGELQHHKYTKVNGKRVKTSEGEPILKYYGEPVIDKGLFNEVQEIIRSNAKKAGNGGGRRDMVNNLFGKMAVCAHCGYSMRYLNKGDPKLHGKVQFKCARAPYGCDNTYLNYEEVERAILTKCKDLNIADILPSAEKNASEKSKIFSQINATKDEISDIEARVNELVKRVENPNIPDYTKKVLENTIATHGKNIEKLTPVLSKLEADYHVLEGSGVQTEEELKSVNELIDKMKDMTGEERHNIRLSLSTQLGRLIDKIEIDSSKKWIVLFFKTGKHILIKILPDGTIETMERTKPSKSIKV